MLQPAPFPRLETGDAAASATGPIEMTRDGVLALVIPSLVGATMARQGLPPHIIHRLAVEGLLP